MSGLAAAVRFDGGPPPRAALDRMIAAARHRAPDGVGRWTDGGVALAKLHRLALPGQQTSAQPFVDRSSSLIVLFDGRLDVRAELAARLSVPLSDADDEAAFAAAAIARSGERAIAMLDGDFALVAWNAATRTLIAARDPFGQRPLHWLDTGGTLLLASDVAQLLAALPRVPAPDESTVADILAFEPPADTRTLYKDVFRVPPGHVLSADARGVHVRQYWRPDPAPADETRGDDEYTEACRALLRRAVRARLRSRTPVMVFFSGGIDSSSVLATAVHEARSAGTAPPLPTTMVFDVPESDEREYRQAFFAKHPLTPVEVPPGGMDGVEYRAQACRRRVLPDMPSEFIGRPLFRRANEMGVRVGLTGAGGDFLFGGSTHAYADLLARGRLFAALARYFRDRRTEESGWTRDAFLTAGVWPLLPRPVRSRLRRSARAVMRIPEAPPWVRLPRPERPAVPDPPPGVSHASWEICWSLRSGWTSVFLESGERGAAEDGVELRHPLWDPAIVQFALSLPERQRRRERTMKFLLRRAADLPPAIRGRGTKADFGHVIEQAFDALGGRRFFETLTIAEAGWVDRYAAAQGYDLTRSHSALTDLRSASLLPRLWMLAAVELWHRGAYGD